MIAIGLVYLAFEDVILSKSSAGNDKQAGKHQDRSVSRAMTGVQVSLLSTQKHSYSTY